MLVGEKRRTTRLLYGDFIELVPRWMPGESLGSRSSVVGESFGLRRDPSQATMGLMFSARKSAYGTPQWFRLLTMVCDALDVLFSAGSGSRAFHLGTGSSACGQDCQAI